MYGALRIVLCTKNLHFACRNWCMENRFFIEKYKRHLSCLFCCNHSCYCVNMVSVTPVTLYITSVSRYITPASRYHPRYQSRSSMYIRGLIPWNFAELAEAVPIGNLHAQRPIPWNHFLPYMEDLLFMDFDYVTLTSQKPCQHNCKFDCSETNGCNIAQ